MTPFEIERLPFSKEAVSVWAQADPRHRNWPVVYLLGDGREGGPSANSTSDVYVGESLNAASRMRQHLESVEKAHLRSMRVVIDRTFNKSVCLDLESYLIRLLAGDGAYRVLNRNDGITEADYFDRSSYRESFREVFDQLRADGVGSYTSIVPRTSTRRARRTTQFLEGPIPTGICCASSATSMPCYLRGGSAEPMFTSRTWPFAST